MEKLYVFLFCMLLAVSVLGQITVTNSGFPKAGDTLMTRIDVTPMISFHAGEGMQSWSFDGLSSPALVETAFLDPDYGSSTFFGSADMVNVFDNGAEYYYRSDENNFYELGYYGRDPLSGFIMINAYYTKPLSLRSAPLNYLDVNQQETSLLVPIPADVIPDTLLDMLPARPDSLRLRIGIQRMDTVNAYGSLSLNQMEFQVLQEKRMETREVFFDAKFPFIGWQDVTDIVEEQFPGFGAGNMDTIVSYYYFSEGVKEPIAVVSVDDRDTPQRVEFKDMRMTASSDPYRMEDVDITASPNPGMGWVEFRISGAPLGKYKIKVRNIIGQPLWEKEVLMKGSENVKVDLTHLKRGTYFYTLVDEDGNSLITKRLVFIRA